MPPLLRRGSRPGATRDSVNVAVYRDQLRELEADLRIGTLAPDQYEKARREIEARLLADVGKSDPQTESPRGRGAVAIALGLAVPLCALAVYLAVGSPKALAPQAADDRTPHGMSGQDFNVLVSRLAARLKDNPEDPEGWVMLGRSYAMQERFREASEAYSNAAARVPQDAQLLADYADALAMAQGRRLQGEPEKIIARALTVDPNNVKALMLAGTAAFNRNDHPAAIRHWERALGLLPAESDMVQSVQASIAEARALGGVPQAATSGKIAGLGAGAQAATPGKIAGQSTGPQAAKSGNNAGSGRVSGVVKLAPRLAAKIAPGDTVFIFARAVEGPRMPLAILRMQGRDLPAEFALDDSMAMSPAAKLSDHPRVVIGARVSKTANAMPQPGDLQGLSAPVKVGADGVNVLIDTELR